MIAGIDLTGVRFPRSMLNSPANGRLLEALGVELVDDCDAELEDFARAWLATVPRRDQFPKHDRARRRPVPGFEEIVTRAVRDALKRMDARRAA